MPAPSPALALILASTSPYRKALLERFNLPFAVDSPNIDESPLAGESPIDTASRLALSKAHAIAAKHAKAIIIGSDQVAVCEGLRLDKPGSLEKAYAQLTHASGRSVTFHTAIALLNTTTGAHQAAVVPTEARFRKLSAREIERYLQAEPALDCAGSAKVEGLGISLMEEVHSPDPTALIGLPLIALGRMLRAEGLFVP